VHREEAVLKARRPRVDLYIDDGRHGEYPFLAEATFHSIAGSLRAGTTAAEILAATALVGQAGFTICDDVAHGFGGG
jgi:hypothetical protein